MSRYFRKGDIDKSDFAKTWDMIVVEELTEEEIKDGLVPEKAELTVCLPGHVLKRQREEGRHFDMEMLEELIEEKAPKFMEITPGEDIALVNSKKTFGAVGSLHNIEGHLYFIVYTVIRQVIVVDGKEVEKEIFISRGTKQI